jgi:hypothetical protein
MIVIRRIVNVSIFVGVLAVSGCGSSNSGGAAGVNGVAWNDDGVATTATLRTATRNISGSRDSLLVLGIASSGRAVSFSVSATAPLTPQTFVCNQTSADQSVSFSYTDSDGGLQLATQSCTVTITHVGTPGGAHASGTFAAAFSLSGGGGTKTITNGSFDLAI